MLLGSIQCLASIASADSVGEQIGRSARKISGGVESAYQTTETTVLNSAEIVNAHANSLQRSVNKFTSDVGQSFNDFLYDIRKGYNE